MQKIEYFTMSGEGRQCSLWFKDKEYGLILHLEYDIEGRGVGDCPLPPPPPTTLNRFNIYDVFQ